VTEAEWDACTDPLKLLDFLHGWASKERMLAFLHGHGGPSDRKARLFAVACRRAWHLLTDHQIHVGTWPGPRGTRGRACFGRAYATRGRRVETDRAGRGGGEFPALRPHRLQHRRRCANGPLIATPAGRVKAGVTAVREVGWVLVGGLVGPALR
jgi:hypothetical protein